MQTREVREGAPRPAARRARTRGATLRRIGKIVLALVVLLAVAVVGGVGWIGSERAIHRAPNNYSWGLNDYPNLKPEPVTIASRTGTRIAGRFFPGRSRTTIILSPGYGDRQEQMLPWADFLSRAGYSVFTYDMRARGQSGGDAITLGALEQEDLLSVIDYVAARPDVDKDKIGALGVSLGGAATVLAAARDPRVKVVVDDCGFSDAPNVIFSAFEHFIHLPPIPFAPVTVAIADLRTGQRIERVRPVDAIGRIAPRPVFIIHGLADAYVPPDNGERNFAAAKEPKQV